MTNAELAVLLRDCLRLWDVTGTVEASADGVAVVRPEGRTLITAGAAPTRWFLLTPERSAAGRGPRPAASISALLSALRAALGVAPAGRARIGVAAGSPSPDLPK